ncbi:MAG: hypothetical protein AAF492_21630, partial [Verrucomicrobiota bacterium]
MATSITGPVSIVFDEPRNPVVYLGDPISLEVAIQGPVSGYQWSWGGEPTISNHWKDTYTFSTTGTFPVVVAASNNTTQATATTMVSVITIPDVHYVSPAGANRFPYDSWNNAATMIQTAIDVARPGRTVLVTNGVYNQGGRLIAPSQWSRVVISNEIKVISVNGPEFTIIEGNGRIDEGEFVDEEIIIGGVVDDGPWEGEPMRCVSLLGMTVLSGFTLTNGYAWSGGGVRSERSEGMISNCWIVGNEARNGGGVYGGTLVRSRIIRNVSSEEGGGVVNGLVYNSEIAYNRGRSAAGAWQSELRQCTIVGNRAIHRGGGAGESIVKNSILYFNRAGLKSTANYTRDCDLQFCCTLPLKNGVGNFTNNPALVSASHILPGSPCVGAGNPAEAQLSDLDDEPWAQPPSVGCDEPDAPLAGNLSVRVFSEHLTFTVGHVVHLDADIIGRPASNLWHFGNGAEHTNQVTVA